MNIKKRIKKDKASKKRTLFISAIIMFTMIYMGVILNNEKFFNGWEMYFVFSYIFVIEILLILYIIKTISNLSLAFTIMDQKLKIKDGLFKSILVINLERVLYVDVPSIKKDFEIFIVIKKGKINKKFQYFNMEFIKNNPQYALVYDHIVEKNVTLDYLCTFIKRGGAKKYYLLYVIFKNAYAAEFSQKALDYIKRFMDEYNMS